MRRVVADPAASVTPFGVHLLPDEIRALEARRIGSREVREHIDQYGREHPDSYAGRFADDEAGAPLVVLFVGDTEAHAQALRTQLHPAAVFEVRRADHTKEALDSLHDRVLAGRDWFATVAAALGGLEVDIPSNRLRVMIRTLAPEATRAIAEQFGASGMMSFVVEGNDPATLPRGSLRGRIVDAAGDPVRRGDLEVRAVGDIEQYEPDGGVGYVTADDGSFVIPRLAAMGWLVAVIDATAGSDEVILGSSHVFVGANETAFVTIEVTR